MTWELALIVLCTLVAVALCGVVVAAGLLMSRPVQHEIGPPRPGLAGAESVRIPSKSGTVLSGWWLNGEPGGGCIVLMHGVRRNRLTMARRAELLHGWGFSVLLFDFQAHGASPGRAITFGHLEALDANAAISFARHRLPAERLGVIGVSLGGAAALLGPGPPQVDALVLESVFPDLRTALINRLHIYLGPVWGKALAPILAPMFRLLMWVVLGVRASTLRPIDHIAGVTAPVLIASGTRDRSTTIEEARTLFHRATDPKQFWAVEGARHVNLERYDPVAYWRVVLPFITRYVQSESQPVTKQSVGT